MFDITSDDIARLSDSDLRILVGKLCESEMAAIGAPVTSVSYGGDQDAADGGVDIRVDCSNLPKPALNIPKPLTLYQSKKSDLPPADIRKEMAPRGLPRPFFKKLAAESGAYVLVSSGANLTDSRYQERKKTMRQCVASLPDNENITLDFFDRQRIATWVNQHLGLKLWVHEKIGKSFSGWQPYGNWSGKKKSDEPFLIDDNHRLLFAKLPVDLSIYLDTRLTVQDGINYLRSLLRQPGKSVRLIGLSGTGKTRLTEALFDKNVGTDALDSSVVIYTNIEEQPSPQPEECARNLIGEQKRGILIIDNCSSELHRRMSEICNQDQSTVSLLSIEFDIQEDHPLETEIVELSVSSKELLEELIKLRYPRISQANRWRIAREAEGNMRIAVAYADALNKGSDSGALQDGELFNRLFEQRRGSDPDLLVMARACALVYSFDGENLDDNGQLAKLGGLVDCSANQVYRCCAELKDRGLLQQRNNWRAVLPQPIANRLAIEALDIIPYKLIESKILSHEHLLKSFAHRIGFLHDSPQAKEIAESWLNRGGILAELNNLKGLGIQMVRHIAPAAPEAVLAALERVMQNLDRGRIPKDFVDNYFSLIRKLAWDAPLFERSISLLITLASTASDYQKTNLEDDITSLFCIHLSGTHATIEQRLAIVQSLLQSDDTWRQGLALKALAAVFKTEGFVISGSVFEFGSRSRDFGYSPRTMQEYQKWYRTALTFVEQQAEEGSSHIAEIQKIIVNNFHGLWQERRLYNELELFCNSSIDTRFKNQCWVAISVILSYHSSKLPAEGRNRLRALHASLVPQDLIEKVRAVVLCDDSHPIDLENAETANAKDRQDLFRRADDTAFSLGCEVAMNASAFDTLLPELFRNGRGLMRFGAGLAQSAQDPEDLWIRLVRQLSITPIDSAHVKVLYGYLSALNERNPSLTNKFFDDAVTDDATSFYFPYLQCAVRLDDGSVKRLIRSLDYGNAPVGMYHQLIYGDVIDSLDSGQIKTILLALACRPQGHAVAVEIFWFTCLHDKMTRLAVDPIILDTGRELLKLIDFEGEDAELDSYITDIAESCLVGEGGAEVARVLAENFKRAIDRRHGNLPLSYRGILHALLVSHPTIILDMLMQDRNKPDLFDFIIGVSDSEQENPFYGIPEDTLVQWCEKDPDLRFPFLAALIPATYKESDKTPPEWTPISLTLLSRAPDRVKVLDALLSNYWPNSWFGSMEILFKNKIGLLKSFLNYSDLIFRDYIIQKIDEFNSEIEVRSRMKQKEIDSNNQGFE